MSQRFNLTAQLQLQAPTNVNQVVGQIRKQLQGITANVQVKGNTRALAQVNKQMQSVSKSAGSASKNVNNLSRNLSEAARRFSVITVATGTMLALARSIKDGVGEAIAFERELVRISQVTGKTTSQLKGLTQEVTRLATGLGASSKDLLNVSRTLAQAGFSAEKTKQALDILAKTSLAATFDTIQDTTEGAIAVLSQFRKEARQAGGDIKFLENTLDAINSVSKSFAVESSDLITVIRRVGGVFEAAGGSVNELIALFTSVRATTRESAETISTGLRTIFTRIQRTDTVDQLKALGIELRNSQGQFVGAFEAVRRLSAGLSSLDPRDFRFSEIVESLGGFRQIGKVIPLIRQFETAQDALNVAQGASGSVARDAAIAQQSLAVQAGKVAQEFKALMRTFTDSSTFKSVAQGALEIARAMIRVADALEPILPMLGILAGLKIGQGVAPLLGGLLAGGRRGGRGSVSKFASGGYVPGSGNRDTVPAMLTPGEFVIKKSSAKKLGPSTLSAMNNNRFATGGQVGIVALKPYDADAPNPLTLTSTVSRADVARKVYGKEGQGAQLGRDLEGKSLGADQIGNALRQFVSKGGVSVSATGSALGDAALGTDLERAITDNFVDSINIGAKQLEAAFKNTKTPVKAKEIKYSDAGTLGIESVIGNAFEGIIASLRGGVFSSKNKNNANFDFISGIGKKLAKLLSNPDLGAIPTDAKRTLSNRQLEEAVTKKYKNQLADAARDLGIGKGPAVAKGTKFKSDQIQQKALGVVGEKGFVEVKDLQGSFPGIRAKDLIAAGFSAKTRARGTTQYVADNQNAGGQVDSVPALLTPGEFVINKSSAQSIGYSNLNAMNKTGVARFNAGGAVDGVQKFQNGGRSFADRRRIVERRRFTSGIRGGISSLDSVSGAAQNFVFAGAAATALASQFSGLSDVTKQAITETAGFVGSIVGLGGTVTQIFTSMAAAGQSEAIASSLASKADLKEASASQAAAARISGQFTGGIIGIVGALTITLGVMKYFQASAKAAADAAFKQRDAILDSIAEGGSGSAAALATVEAEKLRAEQKAYADSLHVAGGAAVAAAGVTAGAFALAGASMGSVVPVVGTLIGAVVGLGVGLAVASQATNANVEAINAQREAIIRSVEGIVQLETAAYDFGEALRRIDEEDLSPEERLTRRQAARGDFAVTNAAVNEARARQQQRFTKKGLGVQQSDFEEDTPEFDSFKRDTRILAAEQKNLTTSLKSAREDLRSASQLEGIFDEGSESAKIYTEAVANVEAALRAQRAAAEKNSDIMIKAATDRANADNVMTEEERRGIKGLEEARDKELSAIDKSIEDNKKADQQRRVTAKKLAEEEIKAAKAAEELRKRLDAIRSAISQLATLENKLKNFAQNIDNLNSVMEGGNQNFTSSVAGLDNLSEIEDVGKFGNDLNRMTKGLPKSMQGAAKDAVDSVTTTASLLNQGRSNVLRTFSRANVSDAGRVGDEAFKDFLKDAGFSDAFSKLPEEIQNEIRRKFDEAAVGGITGKEFDDIFSDVIAETEEQRKFLQRINSLLNDEVTQLQRVLDLQQSLRDKATAAEQKLINTRLRTSELLAKARGEEVNIQARENARVAAAQRGLEGTDLRAGDAAGARALILANNAERRRIAGIDRDTLKQDEKAELARKDKQLAVETEKATAELARLADQSERASDILGELDKERAKQDAAIGILQDFVTGGADQRRAMLRDAAAVNMAIRTGTIQNQTEDQRSRTFALLDRLKDVELVQDPRFGGMTGSDVKKFLTLSDSVRLGLISQEQAFKAMTQTSKEQELINALKDLTSVINQAARAEADVANANVAGVPFTPPIQRRFGGRIGGRSHASGGVPIEAEGGEYIIRKESVAKYGERKLNSVNDGTAAIYMRNGGPVMGRQMGMSSRRKKKQEEEITPPYRPPAMSRQMGMGVSPSQEKTRQEEKRQSRLAELDERTDFEHRTALDSTRARLEIGEDKRSKLQKTMDERYTPEAVFGRQIDSEASRKAYLKRLEDQRAKTSIDRDKIVYDSERFGPAMGRLRREQQHDRRFKAEQDHAALIKRTEDATKVDYRGNLRIGSAEFPELDSQKDARLGIDPTAGQIDIFKPTPLSEIKADPDPPAPKKRETIMEKRARLLSKEQAARTKRGGGPGARPKATEFGGANLGKDFDRKQFEASRQAARDRIADKEKARGAAAVTRASNKRKEKALRPLNQISGLTRTGELGPSFFDSGAPVVGRPPTGVASVAAQTEFDQRMEDIDERHAARAAAPGLLPSQAAGRPGSINNQGVFKTMGYGTPTGGGGGGKSRAQILKQKALDPKRAFGAPPSKRRSSAAVQREKYDIQGSRSGSAVQQRTYGMDHFAQQQQAMGASYQQQQQPGMRRGGFTGQGGVQAASSSGGGLSIDPSQLQGVLSDFIGEFSSKLTELTGPITTMAGSLQGIATSLQNLTMTHTFTGEVGITANIGNLEEIKAAMTEGVKEQIVLMVKASARTGAAGNEQNASEP